MSIKVEKIKRNTLDYILTDCMPVEVSELFTYRYFYEYLSKKKINIIEEFERNLLKQKNKSKINAKEKILLFKSEFWKSIPLSFNIIKGNYSYRKLSLLQPIAVLQISFFISLYNREICNYLEENSIFSLRYHKNNNELGYKKRSKKEIEYIAENKLSIPRAEQTGNFFKIKPYNMIRGFYNSKRWNELNLKYNYYGKIDYKSCFDSIYTHTYKWIITKDINESKNFDNNSLLTVIDRILQNINGCKSNGIVIGPEFSRMMAEILLQQIDKEVNLELINEGLKYKRDYEIFRYVDDIFIFTKREDTRSKIINFFDKFSQEFNIKLNEKKMEIEKLPFIFDEYYELVIYYIEYLDTIFYENRFIIENSNIKIYKKFNNLIAQKEEYKNRIVNHVLSIILKKTHEKINEVNENFLDYIFYIYCSSTTFQSTQKIISILYILEEKSDLTNFKEKIRNLFKKYSFVFSKSNITDIINLLILCKELEIELPFDIEKEMLGKIILLDDPVLFGTFLYYSSYNKEFFLETKKKLNKIFNQKLEKLEKSKNIMLCREFWWILIFNKSGYLTSKNIDVLTTVLTKLEKISGQDVLKNILIDFLKNNEKQFFNWNSNNEKFRKFITYKTLKRTIFEHGFREGGGFSI